MQKEMIKSLKAINFDLDSKALQKIYQSDNPFIYLKAYKQINKFFTDNGFVHRQWLTAQTQVSVSLSNLKAFTIMLFLTLRYTVPHRQSKALSSTKHYA